MIIEKDKIQKAKQKLGNKNADLIAEILNVEQYDEKNGKGLCPFHSEDTPSFVYNKKSYSCHCFGCGKDVDVIEAYMSVGHTFIEAVRFLFDQARIQYNFGEYGVKTKRAYKYPTYDKTDRKDKVYEYLKTRGISQQTVDYLDIQQDSQGNCVFNFYDTNDVLTMVKYRPSHKIVKDPVTGKKPAKTWCQKDSDTSHLLFNMNRVNTTAPLLITEGELDCAAAIESGYLNAVSVPLGAHNYHWIEENWDWLEQFDSIILCSDNDEAGNEMRKEVINRLGSWRTRFVEIPYQLNGKNVKDLNELWFYGGKEAVIDAILNAKDTPVDSVADFSDIQALDLSEMDGIKTGFRDLDRVIMKLYYGTFNILTGINGSGKSSFLTQLICESMDQEKNVFLYSGELPNYQTKNWLNFILAGRHNVNRYESKDGEYFKVNRAVEPVIDEHYRGRLFIYKDGYSNRAEDILDSMEANARKYGCKLFVIDNLTSISLGGSNKDRWEKQEIFINKLIAFAKKYQVVVMLVVHPHKIETVRRLTKMDVQGISAIIDLAHRIFSLYRVQESDRNPPKNKRGLERDVVCDILKDRMSGREGKCIEFYYDRPSRRFFTGYDDLYHQYHWDQSDYSSFKDKYPVPQLENLPY